MNAVRIAVRAVVALAALAVCVAPWVLLVRFVAAHPLPQSVCLVGSLLAGLTAWFVGVTRPVADRDVSVDLSWQEGRR